MAACSSRSCVDSVWSTSRIFVGTLVAASMSTSFSLSASFPGPIPSSHPQAFLEETLHNSWNQHVAVISAKKEHSSPPLHRFHGKLARMFPDLCMLSTHSAHRCLFTHRRGWSCKVRLLEIVSFLCHSRPWARRSSSCPTDLSSDTSQVEVSRLGTL